MPSQRISPGDPNTVAAAGTASVPILKPENMPVLVDVIAPLAVIVLSLVICARPIMRFAMMSLNLALTILITVTFN